MNNDTISRQETLEHLRKRLIETAFNNVGYECDAGKVFEDASKRLDVWLSEVPSAHPEIIRCKDCKHYGRADKRRFYFEADDGNQNPSVRFDADVSRTRSSRTL